ncbi:MAG: DUF3267 domain-containing protein [Oscillospiraceae bacterium]|nr:DUF3267 domain-containing protein [Oscillospiraceae bacterium]
MAEQEKAKKPNREMEERLENTRRLTEQLTAEGYREESAVISVLKANIMAFVISGPLAVAVVVIFWLMNRDISLMIEFGRSSLWFCLLIILTTVIHEGLHGLGWVGFCKEHWKSIRFGVMWESLTPYCHCKEALSVGQYYVGLFLPMTVLGFGISIASLILHNPLLMFTGAINLLMAGGDATIGCILIKYIGKPVKILDHPNQCGCMAFVKE